MAKVITNKGLNILANRIKGVGDEPLYIGWGIGTTGPTNADIHLATEDTTGGYTRATAVSSIITITQVGDTYQVSGSLTANAVLTITEWGLFDAGSGGNMLLREVKAPGTTLAIGGIINFTFKIQMARC
jgi:hypothetical protein